ncbi:DUF7619 domain-containing protein [Flavobacterium stagni]|uniref:T9SS type A sorting domain-containing protein n=1 Tax=Flavobacterium stagni TaxID=2506421 RepID=A0A4Q1KAA1_9FLAO|nr:T9SS type A sorting domain-containing protein [Flavobacterium stagni]RXR21598.1 T9SS type A sorting domain-containing protein [Flavobacterium stagni]
MKSKIFFILLAFSGLSYAQIINFPDANFKAKLLAANSNTNIASNNTQVNSNLSTLNPNGYCKIDVNDDGEIQITEALNIQFLNIYYSNITNLSGIEYFSNLKVLTCNNNPITNHNLTSLQNLIKLEISSNQASSLNLSGLSNLKYLSCVNSSLTNINLTGCISLEKLYCYNNQLTSLNVSNCINLKEIDCDNNQISSLDLSNLSNLNLLRSNSNLLTSINLDNCINLTIIGLLNNLLSELDVSDCHNLQQLFCTGNNLINLNVKNGSVINNSVFFNYSNNPNLTYICADENEISLINSLNNDYNINNCQVNSYCSFTPGGVFYTIQGDSKFDSNNNGCDNNDIIYPNFKCTITNGTITGSFITNSLGLFNLPVQAGTHTITPVLENPTYFTVQPNSFNVSFPTAVSPYNQDFCIVANGNHNDLEIVFLPINQARPGFDAIFKLIYKNKGNTIQSGTINLTFNDDVLDFVSSQYSISSQSTGNLNWTFTNLSPFESREINITFNLNSPTETPPLLSGNVLNYAASINGQTDEFPNDNNIVLNQTVVNSYDPNDKTCLEGTTITTNKIGEYVHYLIRFENNGTANAQNIVVKDIINLNKFDINSLIPISGSHNFETKISNTNNVEFIFQNINLPFDDANNDGYVSFKIKTNSNLIVGDTFSNSANIYFDYNFPIITNNYITTIQNTLGVHEIDNNNEIITYPNPVKDILSFKTSNRILKVEIYDTTGRILSSNSVHENKVDLSQLRSGNYILKVYTNKEIVRTKIVKD